MGIYETRKTGKKVQHISDMNRQEWMDIFKYALNNYCIIFNIKWNL